ncbi:MAG: hypothetical protein JWM25_747 [Thermoleophilia bacterium]|nr:hypothetical protein [Thermoleophilia bacterium]MCZ4496164.1 hypothetical protein [Thermoleophilia bacterium]
MDDHDLEVLRSYRAREAQPPPGLQERLEEDLLHAILDEEAQSQARTRPRRAPARRRWSAGLLRPAMAAGVAAAIAVTVAVWSDGGAGPAGTSVTGVSQAGTNLLDTTASRLFGGASQVTVPQAPIGTINAQEQTTDELLTGPVRNATGTELSDAGQEFARELPRDADALRALLFEAAANATDDEALHERVAFHIAMRWVVDPAVPADLRRSMLLSLNGLSGIEQAVPGVDVLGRQGVVVSHFDINNGIRGQYLLQTNGALLERRAYTAGYIDPACPQYTYTDHALYFDGAPIEPASMAWLDWPQVIPSCDRASSAAR